MKFVKSLKGASLVEYGLLVGLIAVAAIGAVAGLGDQIADMFGTIEHELETRMDALDTLPVDDET